LNQIIWYVGRTVSNLTTSGHVGYEGNRLEVWGLNIRTSIMKMLITTIGLKYELIKMSFLGKLIVFQLIKNKMPFLPLQQTYEESFIEKYSKYM
jgi:hypothetical protein